MDFVFNIDEDVAATNGAGGGKVETGVSPVTIENVFLNKTANGNNVVDIQFVTDAGGKGLIFGICIDAKWASGAENFDYNTWQEFAVLCGMKTGDTYQAKRKMNGKEVPAVAFKEVVGKKLNLGIYEEFDVHQGKETNKLKLSQTFTPSGKTLTEAKESLEPVKMAEVTAKLKPFYTKRHKEASANGGISAGSETTEAPGEVDDTPAQGGLFD